MAEFGNPMKPKIVRTTRSWIRDGFGAAEIHEFLELKIEMIGKSMEFMENRPNM